MTTPADNPLRPKKDHLSPEEFAGFVTGVMTWDKPDDDGKAPSAWDRVNHLCWLVERAWSLADPLVETHAVTAMAAVVGLGREQAPTFCTLIVDRVNDFGAQARLTESIGYTAVLADAEAREDWAGANRLLEGYVRTHPRHEKAFIWLSRGTGAALPYPEAYPKLKSLVIGG